MVASDTDVHGALRTDFHLACTDLAVARRRQASESTAAHRHAVLEAEATIDGVLDMYLDALSSTGTPVSPRPRLTRWPS
jgi:hypothetical protein